MDITLGHLYTPKLLADHFLRHTHETYEIYYMIDGIGRFFIEGTVYDIVPGTLMIMRPGEMHQAIIEPETPYERMFLHFSADAIRGADPELRLLAPFLKRPLGLLNRYNLSNCNISFIEACLRKIDKMTDTNYSDSLGLHIHLLSILWELNKAFSAQDVPAAPLEDNSRISQILYYIHTHLSQKITKQTLCDRFFISPAHLSREFKRATGMAVSDYIRLKRLTLADQRIRAGQPVTQAAAAAGFHDYSSFYRAYRTYYHISPHEAGRRK